MHATIHSVAKKIELPEPRARDAITYVHATKQYTTAVPLEAFLVPLLTLPTVVIATERHNHPRLTEFYRHPHSCSDELSLAFDPT